MPFKLQLSLKRKLAEKMLMEWMEVHDIVQQTRIKTIPQEKEMQKSKMAA